MFLVEYLNELNVTMSSANMSMHMQNKQILVFHEEGFHLSSAAENAKSWLA